jgi:hypothetical protein
MTVFPRLVRKLEICTDACYDVLRFCVLSIQFPTLKLPVVHRLIAKYVQFHTNSVHKFLYANRVKRICQI